jgi:neutral ceramidase
MARSCESHRRLPLLLVGLVFVVTLIAKPNYGEASSPNYMIGVGSHDITGPAADVNMMGYANPAQNAAGIHMRLRARAFIVAESSSSNGGQQQRVVFVNTDACMASTAVTLRVLARLKDRYGDLYTEKNVAISGTHSHSGPGGYLQYVLYIVTSLGFVRQSFDALVNGIEQAIVQAHNNLRPGSIFFNEGEKDQSPTGWLASCNSLCMLCFVHLIKKQGTEACYQILTLYKTRLSIFYS